MPTPAEIDAAATPVQRFPLRPFKRVPDCHNREPYPQGEWNLTLGYHEILALLLLQPGPLGGKPMPEKPTKPRMRWRCRKMSNDCRAWDCLADEEPTPALEGWDCRGCRWLPDRARTHFAPAGKETPL